MEKYIRNGDDAIIILHEIYGINDFIKKECKKYYEKGFDVYCPNLIKTATFSYENANIAYEHFINNSTFDVYKEIKLLINDLKKEYKKVFLLGFSVGATIAWRCCETAQCAGIIGCYGSRIREYTYLEPLCPVLLIFAKKDSFDVYNVIKKLEGKSRVKTEIMTAKHGFLDEYSSSYDNKATNCANIYINTFLIG